MSEINENQDQNPLAPDMALFQNGENPAEECSSEKPEISPAQYMKLYMAKTLYEMASTLGLVARQANPVLADSADSLHQTAQAFELKVSGDHICPHLKPVLGSFDELAEAGEALIKRLTPESDEVTAALDADELESLLATLSEKCTSFNQALDEYHSHHSLNLQAILEALFGLGSLVIFEEGSQEAADQDN